MITNLKKSYWILISIIIFISINNFCISNSEYGNAADLKTSKVSGRIHVDGNTDWILLKNAGECTGSGTPSDPYIIQDLIIDGGDIGNCIEIENSNMYFKIENCTVYNSGGNLYAGIYFNNVENGHLINNNCSLNQNGIYLYHGSDNVILNNSANNNNDNGIRLEQSTNNMISGNIVEYNTNGGIYSVGAYNTISGNTVNYNGYWEIFVFFGDYSNISDNKAHAIILYLSDYNIIVDNTVSNNNGIYLWSSNNTSIFNNTAKSNYNGINIAGSNNNKISNNTITENSNNGIILEDSDDNIITNNTIISNSYGVNVLSSYGNRISSNVINNNGIGINLDGDSTCNEVSNNEFNGNGEDIQDHQGICLEGVPILEISLIVGISIAAIMGIIISRRKRSSKRKITLEEKPLELATLQEKEIVVQEQYPIKQDKLEEVEVIALEEISQEEEIIEISVKYPEELPIEEEFREVEEVPEIEDRADKKQIIEVIGLASEEPTEKEVFIPKEIEITEKVVVKEVETKKVDITEKIKIIPIGNLICQYCGLNNPDDASYCVQCGQPVKSR
ncbi:MAG: right-handed parallel beta-helix repeat-containing protein [Candidatus Lokiarchaeota archaeon]|nr:right-handed parallel beta-helix repeat-containing protein [Candidatus Lokiarchaeota archaeon]